MGVVRSEGTRVFVSSTFTDLEGHREAVSKGIRQLGQVDVAMEDLGARDERPLAECQRLISEESDFFVGIYAHRYGFIPDGEMASITELEYRAASGANLPRLIYLVDEAMPWLPAMVDRDGAASRLAAFKSDLKRLHICRDFTTPDNLQASVVADLGREVIKRQLPYADPSDRSKWPGVEAEAHEWAYPDSDTIPPDRWVGIRQDIYGVSRGVFLTHVVSPSTVPGQRFDILIILTRHDGDNLDDVAGAEFFLGRYWGNRVFPVANDMTGGPIGIWISAYGPALCVCRVTFRDGQNVLIHRYLDFGLDEVARSSEPARPSK